MDKRQALPEGCKDEESFVLDTIHQIHSGSVSYTKANNRRELCEMFWVRKKDFQRLIAAINRLVDRGDLVREEVVTRPTQNFGMYFNPASRTVYLKLAPVRASVKAGMRTRVGFAL